MKPKNFNRSEKAKNHIPTYRLNQADELNWTIEKSNYSDKDQDLRWKVIGYYPKLKYAMRNLYELEIKSASKNEYSNIRKAMIAAEERISILANNLEKRISLKVKTESK